MEKVTVHILKSSLVKEQYSLVLSFVDQNRKEKVLRYVNENDRLLSLGAGYLLKKFLREKEIKENEYGKPFFENGPYFNISHSGEYVVLVIHKNRDVGVDIQQINDNRIKAIEYVLNDKEKSIKDISELYRIWSNKESIVKCISTGLKDIIKVDGLPLEGIHEFENKEFYVKSMTFDGYALSVTLKGKEPFEVSLSKIKKI